MSIQLKADVYPTIADRPTGLWTARCNLCAAPLKSSYQAKHRARKAAAQHLWAHRAGTVVPGKIRTRSSSYVRSQRGPLLPVRGACPRPEKKQYLTEDEAQGHLAEFVLTGVDSPADNAYACRCGFFHVGHNRFKS